MLEGHTFSTCFPWGLTFWKSEFHQASVANELGASDKKTVSPQVKLQKSLAFSGWVFCLSNSDFLGCIFFQISFACHLPISFFFSFVHWIAKWVCFWKTQLKQKYPFFTLQKIPMLNSNMEVDGRWCSLNQFRCFLRFQPFHFSVCFQAANPTSPQTGPGHRKNVPWKLLEYPQNFARLSLTKIAYCRRFFLRFV